MLGSNKRLHHNKDFIRVFKQGKRHFKGGVLLSYKINFQNSSRIGFIVSKKFSNLATHRNKQRRILQASAQTLYPKLKPGFDIIISYTNRDKVLTYKESLKILSEIYSKSQLLK
jgi:ribonuclease P protein component